MPADNEQINLLIALSNNLLAEGLRRIAAEDPTINAVSLGNCNAIIDPDILLFDAHQKFDNILDTYPDTKRVLLYTRLNEQEISHLLVCQKIRGVLSVEVDIAMFHKAIRVVNKGQIWVDQKHLKAVLQHNGVITPSGDIKNLSNKDKQITEWISTGLKNREIAEKLCLCENTIKAHICRIYRRLNVHNRAQLVSLIKDNPTDMQ